MTLGGLVLGACALDESGIVSGNDASGIDSGGTDATFDVVVDAPLPPPCSTVDASCLDAGVPDGWSPLAFAGQAASCPQDFTATALVTNPSVNADTCACGACQMAGVYACGGPVTVVSGGGVGMECTAQNINGTANVCGAVGNHSSITGSIPNQVGGNPKCTAPAEGGTGVVNTETVTACTPSCTADFCGVTSPFKACIVTETLAPSCPPGFGTPQYVGVDAGVSCGCNCAPSAAPSGSSCSAILATFSDGNCATLLDKWDAGPQCNGGGGPPIGSFKIIPNPLPAPTCMLDASAAFGLVGVKTICCP